jgi:hypothetical protein
VRRRLAPMTAVLAQVAVLALLYANFLLPPLRLVFARAHPETAACCSVGGRCCCTGEVGECHCGCAQAAPKPAPERAGVAYVDPRCDDGGSALSVAPSFPEFLPVEAIIALRRVPTPLPELLPEREPSGRAPEPPVPPPRDVPRA